MSKPKSVKIGYCTSCDCNYKLDCMVICPYCEKLVCKGCMTTETTWRDAEVKCCQECAKEIRADT